MIRTHFDYDPTSAVSYAAFQIDEHVQLYINPPVLERVDPEFRQFLSNQVLERLDQPQGGGALIIDLTEARLARQSVALAYVLDKVGTAPSLTT